VQHIPNSEMLTDEHCLNKCTAHKVQLVSPAMMWTSDLAVYSLSPLSLLTTWSYYHLLFHSWYAWCLWQSWNSTFDTDNGASPQQTMCVETWFISPSGVWCCVIVLSYCDVLGVLIWPTVCCMFMIKLTL